MAEVDQNIETTPNEGNTKNWDYTPQSSVSLAQFCEDTFNGGGSYLDGKYLIPHSREWFYNKRQENSYFRNYYYSVIRATYNPVFAEDIERNYPNASGLWNGFSDNSTAGGVTLDDFEKNVIKHAQIQGIQAVVMDNFRQDGEIKPTEQVIAKREYPYVYRRSFDQIAFDQTVLDQFGNLISIVFIEGIDSENQPIYREWDESEWTEFTLDGEDRVIRDSGVHGLGDIPVKLVITGEQKDPQDLQVIPPLYNVAKANFILYQVDSENRDIARASRWPLLFVQGVDGVTSMNISVHTVLGVPEGDSIIAPSYITPPDSIFKDGRAESENIRESLYQLAEQNGVLGNTNQTGISKAYDFFAQESVLKEISKISQTLDDWIQKLFGLYTNTTIEGGAVFKLDFQPIAQIDMWNNVDKANMAGAGNVEMISYRLNAYNQEHAGSDDPLIDQGRELLRLEMEVAMIDREQQLNATKNNVVLDTPNDLEAEAKAKLKGSVGGVQGILAIQEAVSMGTSTYSAGVNTLMELYGYDEPTAKKLLGEPKKITTPIEGSIVES